MWKTLKILVAANTSDVFLEGNFPGSHGTQGEFCSPESAACCELVG